MEGGYQQMDPGAAAAVSVVYFLLMIVFYVYFAICIMKIANKTNTENAWFAWIPILNVFLLLMIARKPLWWFILFLIPIVNIVIAIMVWMAIAEARGKPSWVGILMIIPVLNIVIPGYLAFSS